jgi:hypothetical protein
MDFAHFWSKAGFVMFSTFGSFGPFGTFGTGGIPPNPCGTSLSLSIPGASFIQALPSPSPSTGLLRGRNIQTREKVKKDTLPFD